MNGWHKKIVFILNSKLFCYAIRNKIVFIRAFSVSLIILEQCTTIKIVIIFNKFTIFL